MKRPIKHIAALPKLSSLLSFRAVRSRADAARTREESASALLQEINREWHDFSRAETSPEIPCASAPGGRSWVAQRRDPQHAWVWRDGVERFSAAMNLHEPLHHRGRAALQGRVSPVKSGWALAPATRRTVQALILAVAVFLLVGAGPSDDARFKDLGHRMMCTCGCGQVLLECNHVGCQSSEKMRNQLLASIDKGNNDDLILQGFVQEYGPTVIAAPTATGFNRVAWIMPFVVLALGIAFAVHIVRSWKSRPTPALADGIMIPQGNELDRLRAQARKETDL